MTNTRKEEKEKKGMTSTETEGNDKHTLKRKNRKIEITNTRTVETVQDQRKCDERWAWQRTRMEKIRTQKERKQNTNKRRNEQVTEG